MAVWNHISMLGDFALTSVVALTIACALLLARPASWRVAIWWCVLYFAVLALAAGSQIAFLGWGVGVQGLSFAGLSGHASRAAAVFPVAFFLTSKRQRRCLQGLSALIGMLAAALVAASRVAIGAHSLSEACSGYVLGTAGALATMACIRTWRGNFLPIAMVALGMAALFSGTDAVVTTESVTHQWLTGIALNLSGHDRVYSRDDWKPAAIPYGPPCEKSSVRFKYLCL